MFIKYDVGQYLRSINEWPVDKGAENTDLLCKWKLGRITIYI